MQRKCLLSGVERTLLHFWRKMVCLLNRGSGDRWRLPLSWPDPETKGGDLGGHHETQPIIAAIGGLALTLLGAQAQAAEIKVLSSTAMKTALEELGPQFEKATGTKSPLPSVRPRF